MSILRIPPELAPLWNRLVSTRDVDEVMQQIAAKPDELEGLDRLFVFRALCNSDWELANALADRIGTSLFESDGDGGPLHETIEHLGDTGEIVAWFLNRGCDPNQRWLNNWCPIHHAANRGYAHVVRMLLDAGVDPNVGTEIDGDLTPLMEAAACGHWSVVLELVTRGAEVRRVCYMTGRTAARMAHERGHRELGEYLDRLR